MSARPHVTRLVACAVLALAAALAVPSPLSSAAEAPATPLDRLRSASAEAQRLIEQGDTGARTQQVQQGIVDELDALIKAMSAQEGMSVPLPGKKPAAAQPRLPSGATGPPRKPAAESVLPLGEWTYGRLAQPGQPGEAWLPQLPPAQQKAIADTFRAGRLPPRYEELLREYNKRLAQQPGR